MSRSERRVSWWRPPTRAQALLLAAVVALTVLGVAVIGLLAGPDTASPDSAAPIGASVSASQTPRSDLPGVALADLPTGARETLALIDRGGPYPYDQDHTVFGNNEKLLPERPRGYYREYTVITPGSSSRGTRRLVVGQAGDVFYTADHYESFRQVLR